MLRQLIFEQASKDTQIAGMLASYNGEPAFFYSKSPSDIRLGWGTVRYPRVDFTIDTMRDPERKSAGTMTVNIFVTTQTPAVGNLDPDKAIEERLIELFSNTLYTDEAGVTYCVEWQRTDEFVLETEKSENFPEVYGLTVTFDILAFPLQITTNPDPVQGLNRWTRKFFEEIAVIGYDDLPSVFKPSGEKAALYWRFEGTVSDARQSYAVTWYTGTFCAHILTDSVVKRNRLVKAVVEKLQINGEVILADGSPMFVDRVVVRHNADPLKEGQIEISGKYGVLTQLQKETARFKLNHAGISAPSHWQTDTKGEQ